VNGLAVVGKITEIMTIPNADRIVLATAVCGKGGIWRGVVKADSKLDDIVVVFQPDALLPSDNPAFSFMESSGYRVRQRRFRGAPSESLIMPISEVIYGGDFVIGQDVSDCLRIDKYEKPVSVSIGGEVKGDFPEFVPKTDEPNFQKVTEMFSVMIGRPYYVTMKMDGTSTTAYRRNGVFGVCSRNLELKEGSGAGWLVAKKYNLGEMLPDGYAIQFEVCGPGIQKNPISLKSIDGYAFQLWNIAEKRYLDFDEFASSKIMPTVPIVKTGEEFNFTPDSIQSLAEDLKYPNGKPAEGIVCRPTRELSAMINMESTRISFKVINLRYKD
jgi:RNA ligase (TIGR02306 family)